MLNYLKVDKAVILSLHPPRGSTNNLLSCFSIFHRNIKMLDDRSAARCGGRIGGGGRTGRLRMAAVTKHCGTDDTFSKIHIISSS